METQRHELEAWLGPALEEMTEAQVTDLYNAVRNDSDSDWLGKAQELFPAIFPK